MTVALISILCGLLAWSLLEYGVHRFILHSRVRLFRRYHAIHHRDPHDGHGVPYAAVTGVAAVAIPLSFVLFGLPGTGFALGLLTGYVAYVMVHEGMHHHPDWLPGNNRRHDIHHLQWRYNFGVTTPLWDRVFGTFKSGKP